MKKLIAIAIFILSASIVSALPLSLSDQGVFSAGGIVIENEGTFDPISGQYDPDGQLLHADHANVFYQIPEASNGHAMVFLHGYKKSYEKTHYYAPIWDESRITI